VILYGRNPVMEALRGRRRHTITGIWSTRGAAREPWLAGRDVLIATAQEIETRCGASSHQGICAEAGPYPYVSARELLEGEAPAGGSPPRVLVALDQVQDPQNLGSICRTSECVGAWGVVVPERRSAHVSPAVCKASAGAVEHLRMARVRNLADFLGEGKQSGWWCYGASLAPGSRSYEKVDYEGSVVLVLGSEASGLRPRVQAACDELVSLPLRGRTESLGVAAAAAALLYGIGLASAGLTPAPRDSRTRDRPPRA
jgi:23S rRNA (guanosine2251-2'-O)-methyltransferase